MKVKKDSKNFKPYYSQDSIFDLTNNPFYYSVFMPFNNPFTSALNSNGILVTTVRGKSYADNGLTYVNNQCLVSRLGRPLIDPVKYNSGLKLSLASPIADSLLSLRSPYLVEPNIKTGLMNIHLANL